MLFSLLARAIVASAVESLLRLRCGFLEVASSLSPMIFTSAASNAIDASRGLTVKYVSMNSNSSSSSRKGSLPFLQRYASS